jgi:hypothetical protein
MQFVQPLLEYGIVRHNFFVEYEVLKERHMILWENTLPLRLLH